MNTNTERNKKIDAMRAQLKAMHKRSQLALKKAKTELKKNDKKYQKELADFKRKYGE